MSLSPCGSCRRRYVPEVILSSIDLPGEDDGKQEDGGLGCRGAFPVVGVAQLLEARVCRAKPKLYGEANATMISEALPFIE
jgi:hypothetical protein